jgi:hypothetical protein
MRLGLWAVSLVGVCACSSGSEPIGKPAGGEDSAGANVESDDSDLDGTSPDGADGSADSDGGGDLDADGDADADADVDGGTDDTGGSVDERRKKVLTIMVDGWRPDVIHAAATPTIDAIWPDSAYSLKARVEDTTISGSGQSTFVTGVHRDKHGVDDNSFEGRQYDLYPYWFRHLDEAAPHLVTAAYHTWFPMYEHALGGEDGADFAYFWSYSDDDGDERTTTQLKLDLLTEDLDAIVWMLSDLDTNGHSYGFSTDVPQYVAGMELIDEQIGQVLQTIQERGSIEDEDWMVIISTDHAGSGTGHGSNIPEHRLVPLFIHGGAAVPGPIWPSPNTVSVVSTALTHLGVDIDPAWELDGVAVGLTVTAPPEARLDTNLIVNSGADMERGFWGESPDASLVGWTDHGQVTATKYGSDGYLSLEDPGPEARGDNFFCGGGSSSDELIYQDIALSALSEDIDTGSLGYELQGWLGGYSDQADRAELLLELFDVDGAVIVSETLPAVTASERSDETSLIIQTRFGMVPPFVRSARITVNFIRSSGINDGYADNLVFKLTSG